MTAESVTVGSPTTRPHIRSTVRRLCSRARKTALLWRVGPTPAWHSYQSPVTMAFPSLPLEIPGHVYDSQARAAGPACQHHHCWSCAHGGACTNCANALVSRSPVRQPRRRAHSYAWRFSGTRVRSSRSTAMGRAAACGESGAVNSLKATAFHAISSTWDVAANARRIPPACLIGLPVGTRCRRRDQLYRRTDPPKVFMGLQFRRIPCVAVRAFSQRPASRSIRGSAALRVPRRAAFRMFGTGGLHRPRSPVAGAP